MKSTTRAAHFVQAINNIAATIMDDSEVGLAKAENYAITTEVQPLGGSSDAQERLRAVVSGFFRGSVRLPELIRTAEDHCMLFRQPSQTEQFIVYSPDQNASVAPVRSPGLHSQQTSRGR
jgi:hypothetical protein